jgi:uncharacterized protein YlzI (FlbEa/FlbD family)
MSEPPCGGTTLLTAFIGALRKHFMKFRRAFGNRSAFIFPASPPIRMDEPQERGQAMIELTRLNGTPMMLNSDLIKTAEASPDTMLTLIHGEKLIVRESIDEVSKRVLAYRALLLTNVALRLHPFTEVQKVVSLASLDLSENPSSAGKLGCKSDPEADR